MRHQNVATGKSPHTLVRGRYDTAGVDIQGKQRPCEVSLAQRHPTSPNAEPGLVPEGEVVGVTAVWCEYYSPGTPLPETSA